MVDVVCKPFTRLSYEMAIAEEVVSYHVPPTTGLRSNTRIVSKAPSLTKASVAMAPAGPAPMTATRRML